MRARFGRPGAANQAKRNGRVGGQVGRRTHMYVPRVRSVNRGAAVRGGHAAGLLADAAARTMTLRRWPAWMRRPDVASPLSRGLPVALAARPLRLASLPARFLYLRATFGVAAPCLSAATDGLPFSFARSCDRGPAGQRRASQGWAWALVDGLR
jgi:hypothetical protein